MVFSSLLFLFRFLPIVLLAYYILPKKCRNFVLFLSSLVFYAWGEPVYVVLILLSTCVDYAAGLAVLGLFSGIFVGGWILALAEIVNIFPILTRRIGLTKGLSLVVIAIALGKMSGSLIHFYFRW